MENYTKQQILLSQMLFVFSKYNPTFTFSFQLKIYKVFYAQTLATTFFMWYIMMIV